MVKLIIILFSLLLVNIISYSQEEYGFGVGEIYVGTSKPPNDTLVSYKMQSVGALWGGGPLDNQSYLLNPDSPDYKIAYAVDKDSNLYFFDSTNFSIENDWPILRLISPFSNRNCRFGYGLYKFNVEQYSNYFYIDYRDRNYSTYSNCNGNCNDIWIKYDQHTNNFYYLNDALYATDPNSTNWTIISKGSLLFFYKMKGQSRPKTDSFPNFWTNCLTAVPNADNNPYIIFGPHPTLSNPSQYQIFRGTNLSDSTDEDYYAQIGFTADSVFIHTDNDVDLSDEYNSVYYFVKAKNSSQLSSRSNITSIKGRIPWNKTLFLKKVDLNPRLLWSKYPTESNILGYIIKKSTNNNAYIALDTVNNNVFHYDDLDVTIGGSDTSIIIKYCIVARFQGSNSSASNEVIIHIDPEVQKKGHTGLINEFNINQNYPNPFNPTTKISYTIPLSPPFLKGESGAGGFVTLKVYDLLGKEVALLVNENQNAGSYSVDFSGKNLSAGTYFYELKAGSFREVKKMLLLK